MQVQMRLPSLSLHWHKLQNPLDWRVDELLSKREYCKLYAHGVGNHRAIIS